MNRMKKWVLSLGLLALLIPTQNAGAAAQIDIPQVKAGKDFSIAHKSDGTVWAWGSNSNGQLGDGTTNNFTKPAKVAGLSDVTSVAAGEAHSLALKKDGTVWAWGSNINGQVGDGTATDRLKPVQVNKLDQVIAIEAGGSHSIAIKENGTVWVWGKNEHGQLGDGTNSDRSLPVQVEGIDHAKAVAAGMSHTVVLKDDGTVWTWGYNMDGQIGDGTYYSTTVPVKVEGLSNIIAIASGGSHSFALYEDGSVWVWGRNADGQLGDGTPDSKNHPIKVEGITKAVSVSAGQDFSFAITEDGTVWGWGSNYIGQLGLDTSTIAKQMSPMKVEKLTDTAAIDGGELHAVVYKKDGTVWGMGKNEKGQLGNVGDKEVYSPIQVNDFNIGKMPTTDIYMRVESTQASVNGKEHKLEVAPFYLDGRTMVPVRFIGEAMGVKVGWDGQDQSVTLTRGDIQIKLQIDNKEAYVNGSQSLLDAPPIIKDDVTMVPLRFISESLNLEVQFDNGNIRIKDK